MLCAVWRCVLCMAVQPRAEASRCPITAFFTARSMSFRCPVTVQSLHVISLPNRWPCLCPVDVAVLSLCVHCPNDIAFLSLPFLHCVFTVLRCPVAALSLTHAVVQLDPATVCPIEPADGCWPATTSVRFHCFVFELPFLAVHLCCSCLSLQFLSTFSMPLLGRLHLQFLPSSLPAGLQLLKKLSRPQARGSICTYPINSDGSLGPAAHSQEFGAGRSRRAEHCAAAAANALCR